MRVTDSIRYDLINRRLSSLQSNYLEVANQATTGQRVNNPSEDPAAAAEASRIRSGLSKVEAQQSNLDMVQGDVESAESTLSQVGEILQRIGELAMTGSNDTYSADDRKALSLEVSELTKQVISLANTQGSRGYLFSGTLTDTATLDSSGQFQANDAEQLLDLGVGEPVGVSVSGARAFTAVGGRDIVATLRTLASALEANDSAGVRAMLGDVQESHDQVQRERSRAGMLLNRLEMSSTVLEQTQLNLQK
ncbi:MAG TPA: flagellar hook-associated protein FlgL, partial [Polyangiaceae bacterium]|nr:flagellar hook-associated protein FlgL [Polyangiaceae bacterium]